jgi:retron-type reverse transcriptase
LAQNYDGLLPAGRRFTFKDSGMWEKVYNFQNLYDAYNKAKRNKRYRKEVIMFSHNLERELFAIQEELINKTYRVGAYRPKIVYEPKKRMIVALPFKDRIVQHALNNLIEPLFDTSMIFDSYACRRTLLLNGHLQKKGTHQAAKRLGYFMGKPHLHHYLKIDIRKYFASVDHDILKQIIRRRLKDENMLWLIDLIIDSAPDTGLPIGNLMSQLFANVYLHEVDHHFKNVLGVKFYIRYMDDMIILHESKAELHRLFDEMTSFCSSKLNLQLNDKSKIGKTKDGITFVGYRVWNNKKLIKKQSIDRMKKKYRAWKSGKIRDEDFVHSLGSWMGHTFDTASHRIIETVMFNVIHHLVANKGYGTGQGRRKHSADALGWANGKPHMEEA